MFKKTFSSSGPKPRGKFGDNKKREFKGGGPGGPRFFQKKTCRFCADKNSLLDYKDTERLRKFLTEKGKIMPRRITGNCAKCQRMLTRAIKRSRHAGFVAFQID